MGHILGPAGLLLNTTFLRAHQSWGPQGFWQDTTIFPGGSLNFIFGSLPLSFSGRVFTFSTHFPIFSGAFFRQFPFHAGKPHLREVSVPSLIPFLTWGPFWGFSGISKSPTFLAHFPFYLLKGLPPLFWGLSNFLRYFPPRDVCFPPLFPLLLFCFPPDSLFF